MTYSATKCATCLAYRAYTGRKGPYMDITPQYEMREKKILDIFQKMSWEEQYTMIGSLRGFANLNYNRLKAQETEASTCQTFGKVIQFHAAARI